MSLPARKTVLILGATGRFGHAAMHAFLDAGWHVHAQVRRPVDSLPPSVRLIGTDLFSTDKLVADCADASVVVYAVNPVYTEWGSRLLPMAKQGMTIAERLGALFMLPGNVYQFGDGMPERLVETTAFKPTTRKGALRAALEDEMQLRINRGLRSVVIRAGDFFGGGIGNWFDEVIVKSIASKKRLVYPGPLDCVHAWAYLPDLTRAFVGVAERHLAADLNAPVVRQASTSPTSITGSFKKIHFAGHNVTGAALLAAIERAAERLNIAAPGVLQRGGMPWAAVRIGGIFKPMWREVAEMSYLWRVSHAVESIAMAKILPSHMQTPLDSAVENALVMLGHTRAPHDVPRGGIGVIGGVGA
jgi:NAD(P)-dependent dehydrogenase (short-subunit alcohol dehydrogenase family)